MPRTLKLFPTEGIIVVNLQDIVILPYKIHGQCGQRVLES